MDVYLLWPHYVPKIYRKEFTEFVHRHYAVPWPHSSWNSAFRFLFILYVSTFLFDVLTMLLFMERW